MSRKANRNHERAWHRREDRKRIRREQDNAAFARMARDAYAVRPIFMQCDGIEALFSR